MKEEEKSKFSILDAIATANEWEAKEIEWIIPHVIPRGCLTMISGREEYGERVLLTQLCVDLAAGKKTVLDSDDFEWRKPMRIIYLDAEEHEEDVVERFHALGVNDNVVTLDMRHPAAKGLTTTSDSMRELVEGYRPDLMVLAPIFAFTHPRYMASSNKNTIATLHPLMRLAEEFNCAIVILQEASKTRSSDYIRCIAGSAYFCVAPRSILMMDKTRTEDEVFVSVEKSNLSSVYEPFETRILKFRKDRQALELVGTTTKKWKDFHSR